MHIISHLHKSRSRSFFVDAQTKEELTKDAGRHGIDANSIVDVDYLIKSNNYEEYIKDSFGIIIADNVFEHISNPIKWLKTLERLLNEDGFIFLCVPERGECFDKFRQLTPFSHILTDYTRDVPDLDPEHSVEVGIYYDNMYVGQENILSDKINLERSIRDYQNPHYGVHCHTFWQKTFVNKIMKPILLLDMLNLKIVDCISVSPREFLLCCKKAKKK